RKQAMQNFLRILVIALLLSILGLQIYFLLVKHNTRITPKPIVPTTEDQSINQAEPPNQEAEVSSRTHTTVPEPVSQSAIEKKDGSNEIAKLASYHVDSSKCISCNLCVINCPVNAIKMEGGVAVIDKDKCIGCGICVDGNNENFAGCPVEAISKTETRTQTPQ
ncbi:MAG: 4Fe-4S binding protein, partial [Candidatus Cloacimonadaceae bacterium]|nr:4Fe-4S binding protein [Candidatus Cloacimonadaceae bacterium]